MQKKSMPSTEDAVSNWKGENLRTNSVSGSGIVPEKHALNVWFKMALHKPPMRHSLQLQNVPLPGRRLNRTRTFCLHVVRLTNPNCSVCHFIWLVS
jgi:hypothetical protein